MTKGTFGESLKREREMRGVTLDEISAATRIATRFLRAIENEDWDQLPGGVFNRGFVRAVARYLGLDEENTVAEYASAVGDRPSVPVWTGSPPLVAPEQHWLAWIVAAVLFLALLAGAWFGTRRLLAWRAAKRKAQAVAVTDASSLESDSAPEETAAVHASPINFIPGAKKDDAISGTPAIRETPKPLAAPISPATPPFELEIDASRKTEVTVVADKEVVFDGTIKAGEIRSYSATDHFQVTAQDAGALQLELNGKPLAPFGASGQAGKITLTRNALNGISGGEN